jgi:hypothetical protein
MRKLIIVAAALTVVGISTAAQADVIAYWNFNNGTNLGGTTGCFSLTSIGTATTSAEYPSDFGSGVAEISAWNTGGGDLSEGNLQGPNGTGGTTAGNLICSFAGSTLNSLNGDAGGGTLSPVGSAQNGKSFLIEIDSAISGASLTYATRGTGTGYNLHTYDCSTDGGATFSSCPTASNTANQTATFSVLTVNLGNVFASTSGHESNIIRITVSGAAATSTNGNNRFDNVQINGTLVPEPAAISLLALGALALIRRRR